MMLCQCHQVTPVQTRSMASVSSVMILSLVYWSLCSSRFAYAGELVLDGTGQSRDGKDHNWFRLHAEDEQDGNSFDGRLGSSTSPRSIDRRASAQYQFQGNNIATSQDAIAGSVGVWQYPSRFLTSANTTIGIGLPPYSEDLGEKRAAHVELRKKTTGADGDADVLQVRQDDITTKTLYISGNTCTQPHWVGAGTQSGAPPQLTLYVSTTSENQNPGPDGDSSAQIEYPFAGGFVNASVPDVQGAWYVAVYAPEISPDFTGMWNYRLAISLDDYFYQANPSTSFLNLLDTDLDSALFMTDNLTTATQDHLPQLYQQWMNLKPPYIMFAINQNVTNYLGVESSFCGLQNAVKSSKQIQASTDDLGGNTTGVQMHMISRGIGHHPKQQFYVDKLNASSAYAGFLAMDGNSTSFGDGVVRGGGTVWQPITFKTKSDGNCQLMFDLPFCEELAYAVPANPNNPNATLATLDGLRHFYDNYTSFWFQNFNNSLQVLPCKTISNAQYSVAKNCTDCRNAYKEWLCAVSIPRCEDFSNDAEYLQIRNVGQPFVNNQSMLSESYLNQIFVPMSDAPTIEGSVAFQQTLGTNVATNQSRNKDIDTYIMPGPYKETKPCADLCYSLMQSCPAALGFACPYPGRGLEVSYGQRGPEGTVQCSFLGAYHFNTSSAMRLEDPIRVALAIAIAVSLELVFI